MGFVRYVLVQKPIKRAHSSLFEFSEKKGGLNPESSTGRCRNSTGEAKLHHMVRGISQHLSGTAGFDSSTLGTSEILYVNKPTWQLKLVGALRKMRAIRSIWW
jgi:hypothetical protein